MYSEGPEGVWLVWRRSEHDKVGQGPVAGSCAGPIRTGRPPGRPRKTIDMDAVADGAGNLFAAGGYNAVTIEAVAEKLAASRATLYRTVGSKEELLGILFERSTQRLHQSAAQLVAERRTPREELVAMVRLHTAAAIETRRHMTVFFGGGGLPPDVVERWWEFTRAYESLWLGVVKRSMEAGIITPGDATLTTRLLLGMPIWLSRWYKPDEVYDGEQIADRALISHDGAP